MWGFSPELFEEAPAGASAEPPAEPPPGPGPAEQQAAMAEFGRRYPHVLEIALAATGGDLAGSGGGCDEQFEFEFALDLLLDGFDRLRERGWTSRRPAG
jgi:hypothetical protein